MIDQFIIGKQTKVSNLNIIKIIITIIKIIISMRVIGLIRLRIGIIGEPL